MGSTTSYKQMKKIFTLLWINKQWALLIIPFSLVSSGQIHVDTTSKPIVFEKNVDTPAGGTDLGKAIQEYNCAASDLAKARQIADSKKSR